MRRRRAEVSQRFARPWCCVGLARSRVASALQDREHQGAALAWPPGRRRAERTCRPKYKCYLRAVLPADIQKLRKDLACTARELATTLGVDPKEVAAWESGEQFPTKRNVESMRVLLEKGPSAITRQPRGKPAAKTGMARLSDPALWRMIRKLVEHPALFDEVAKLSEKYPDPAEPPAGTTAR